jgi:hypothetical protein
MTRPLWAVALWAALLAGLCVAWSPRYWAVAVTIAAVSLVAVGWTVAAMVELRKDPEGIRLPWQSVLVVLIGAWPFLQIALKITVVPQLTMYSGVVWGISAVGFLVSAEILREREARGVFLSCMMWSVTVLAVIATVQFFSHSNVFGVFEASEGVFGTLIYRNQFAALMEMAGPVALWYMLERNFWLGGICYVLIASAAIASASRAGFVLMCGELVVFMIIVLAQRRREAKGIVATFAALALIVGLTATIAGTERIRQRFEDSDPYAVRRELLASTKKLIAERPVTGFGMGTWPAIYPHVASFDEASEVAIEAHNDWAQWTAEGGPGFLILMAALVISIAIPATRSVWGLGILSVMAHSYLDFPVREPVLSVMWFVLAGAAASMGWESRERRRRRGRRAEEHLEKAEQAA